jgi:hypothetical protein
MRIKLNQGNCKAVTGIPAAQVITTPGVTGMGASQVIVCVSALDSHGLPDVVASVRLSVAEARDLAARLIATADEADSLLANPTDDAVMSGQKGQS